MFGEAGGEMTKSKEELAREYAENEGALVKKVPVFTVDKHLGFPQRYELVKVRNEEAELGYKAGYDARQAEVDELKNLWKVHQDEEVYVTQVVKQHHEIQELKKELDEQCRLNGIGASRELVLMTQVDELRKSKCDHIDQKHWSAAKYEDEIQEIKQLKKDLLLAQLSRNDWESISKNLAVQTQELKKDKDILDFIESSGIDFAKFGSYWCYDGQPNNEPYCASLRVVVGKAMKESKDGK